jgi:hypothetical protein
MIVKKIKNIRPIIKKIPVWIITKKKAIEMGKKYKLNQKRHSMNSFTLLVSNLTGHVAENE